VDTLEPLLCQQQGQHRRDRHLLRATNRLPEAEPIYRRALAIDEKSFGPEHPNVAGVLNNLAQLLRPPTDSSRPSR
jgi:Tetratricopeptide repeat